MCFNVSSSKGEGEVPTSAFRKGSYSYRTQSEHLLFHQKLCVCVLLVHMLLGLEKEGYIYYLIKD